MAWEPRENEPHMFDYWHDKYGLERCLRDYYPDTLKNHDEIRTLFYVWCATGEKALEKRICEVMEERGEKFKHSHPERFGEYD